MDTCVTIPIGVGLLIYAISAPRMNKRIGQENKIPSRFVAYIKVHDSSMPNTNTGIPFQNITLQWRHNGRNSVSNQPFIQMQIKENIKAPRHWPLCGEFTGNRRIPRTNGQLRGKCFHLMTSSWNTCDAYVCHWAGPSLVQAMVRCPLDFKPELEPQLTYCHLPRKVISNKFCS